jgi:exonuclease III
LNINGITATTKVWMLGEFLRNQDIDVLCRQEVSTTAINNIANCTTDLNIGTEGRGRAIIIKDV